MPLGEVVRCVTIVRVSVAASVLLLLLLLGVMLFAGSASACVGLRNFDESAHANDPLSAGVNEYGMVAHVCNYSRCTGVYDMPCGLPSDPRP